jgi:hypothetical protein
MYPSVEAGGAVLSVFFESRAGLQVQIAWRAWTAHEPRVEGLTQRTNDCLAMYAHVSLYILLTYHLLYRGRRQYYQGLCSHA